MDTTPHGWKIFDDDMPILVYEYSFGSGMASAVAVATPAGLIVISPPWRAAPTAFEDLARYGPVRVLIAPNAFHTLGLAEWKARFPQAAVHAPAQSIARVERRCGLRGVRPVNEVASLAGPRVECIDMPHYRTGEVLVRIAASRGLVWYVTDVILNFQELPRNLIARLAFGLSGSGPGLRFNNIAPLFMVADKAALRSWLASEFRKSPPRWLIPAHGSIVDFAANPDAARDLFAST